MPKSLRPAALRDDAAIRGRGYGSYAFSGDNPLGLLSLRLSESEVLMVRQSGSATLPYARGQTLEARWPGHPNVPALVSAAWVEAGQLRLRCHAIGDAPCGFDMLISVDGNRVVVQSRRSSDPLTEGYQGVASGVREEGGDL